MIAMPLVVPGINSTMGDKSEWVNKLMGKKISEGGSDEVVSLESLKKEGSREYSILIRSF
jgi:hypothetical protein